MKIIFKNTRKLFEKSYKILALIVLIIFLFSCNNNFNRNELNWEKEQINKTFNKAQNMPKKFISLGFYKHSDINIACDSAKDEALFHLPEVIKLYTKTRSSVIQNNNTNEYHNISLVTGKLSNLKEKDIVYKTLSKVRFDKKFYVALIAIVDRDKVIDNYMQYVNQLKSKREYDFDKKVNKLFLKNLKSY